MTWLIYLLLILIFIDFLLLYKKTRKFISKKIKRKIDEKENVGENLMIGLLSGLMIWGITSGNESILILSMVFILMFMIWRAFSYKKIRRKRKKS